MKYLPLLLLVIPLLLLSWAKLFLLTPSEQIFEKARKFFLHPKLPEPAKGSTSRKLHLIFYRAIGVGILIFCISAFFEIISWVIEF